MNILNDVRAVEDAEEFRDIYERLDDFSKNILSSAMACLLARQQMEEEQKEAG